MKNKSQSYNGNIASRRGSYSELIEMLMKAYKSAEYYHITALPFLAKYKQACDSNEFLKATAFRTLPMFLKNGLAFILAVRTTFYEDDGNTLRQHERDKEQISTYAEAVNFLLKQYATDPNTTKKSLGSAAWKNYDGNLKTDC